MGKNVIKLAALLTTLTALFVGIGGAVGGTGGMVMAAIFALLMNGGAYWFSDKLVLRFAGAREPAPGEMTWLQPLVAQLAGRAGLPVPRLYIIDSDLPNAFATGRNPERGVVAVTTGLSRMLTREELAGVIAHELAHIKNRDTLLSAVVATLAGAVSMIANIGQFSLLFGGGNDDSEEGGGLLSTLAMLIVAPLAAAMIQLGISRAREFQADDVGARILGDPLPLASALEKLEWSTQRANAAPVAANAPAQPNPAVASLYIVNPFGGAGGMGLLRLFSTHPPTEERISRLRELSRRQYMGSQVIVA